MFREAIVMSDVIEILTEMTSDWELDDFRGAITGQTRLVADLAMESVDLVQLMVALEQKYGIRNFAAEKLLTVQGQIVSELEVYQVVRFVAGLLGA
jgi:acyl carrier protein